LVYICSKHPVSGLDATVAVDQVIEVMRLGKGLPARAPSS